MSPATTPRTRLALDRRAVDPRSHRAFTLIETMMALVIISWGILAFVDAQAAFHKSNMWSSQSATGMLLANEIREFTRYLPRHDQTTGLGPAFGREAGEVTIDDLDDLDDLDGVTFGQIGTFTGPIDALGTVVPEIDIAGVTQMAGGVTVPLQGWSQRVVVDKVEYFNYADTRADSYERAASAQFAAIPADGFPLRVTVIVEYQGLDEAIASEVTRISWVVTP